MYREVDELIDGISVVRDFGLDSRFLKRLEAAAIRLLQESHTTAYLNLAMIPLCICGEPLDSIRNHERREH